MYRVLICVVLSLAGYVNSWPLERSFMNTEEANTNLRRSQENLLENVTEKVKKTRLELDMNALNSLWPDDEEPEIANRFGDSIDTIEEELTLSENSTTLLSSPPPVGGEYMRNDSTSNVAGKNITLDHKFLSYNTIQVLWDRNLKLNDKVNSTVDTPNSRKAEPPTETTKEQRNTSVEPNLIPALVCNVSYEENANAPPKHATSSEDHIAKQRGIRNNKHQPYNVNVANQENLVQEHRTNHENNRYQTKKNTSSTHISCFIIVIIPSMYMLFPPYYH